MQPSNEVKEVKIDLNSGNDILPQAQAVPPAVSASYCSRTWKCLCTFPRTIACVVPTALAAIAAGMELHDNSSSTKSYIESIAALLGLGIIGLMARIERIASLQGVVERQVNALKGGQQVVDDIGVAVEDTRENVDQLAEIATGFETTANRMSEQQRSVIAAKAEQTTKMQALNTSLVQAVDGCSQLTQLATQLNTQNTSVHQLLHTLESPAEDLQAGVIEPLQNANRTTTINIETLQRLTAQLQTDQEEKQALSRAFDEGIARLEQLLQNVITEKEALAQLHASDLQILEQDKILLAEITTRYTKFASGRPLTPSLRTPTPSPHPTISALPPLHRTPTPSPPATSAPQRLLTAPIPGQAPAPAAAVAAAATSNP